MNSTQNETFLSSHRTPFASLFVTQLLGALNDNVVKSALIARVSYQMITLPVWLSPSLAILLASLVAILPFFVFSQWSGDVNSSFRPGPIAVSVKCAEIVIVALAAYGFLQNSFFVLLLSLFLLGVHSTFFGPLKYSLIPQIVKSRQLPQANAWIESSTFIAILFGTFLGTFWATDHLNWVIGTVIVTAVVGCLAALRLSHQLRAYSNQASDLHHPFKLKSPLHEVIRFYRDRKQGHGESRQWETLQKISWFWLIGAGMTQLLPLIYAVELEVSPIKLAMIQFFFSVGIGAGSFLGSLGYRYLSPEQIIRYGSISLSAFLQFAALFLFLLLQNQQNFSTWISVPIFVFVALSGGVISLPLYVEMQKEKTDTGLPHYISLNNFFNAAYMVAGSVLQLIIFQIVQMREIKFSIYLIVLSFGTYFFFNSRNTGKDSIPNS